MGVQGCPGFANLGMTEASNGVGMARKRIGEVLLERGLVTAPQLAAALERQRRGGGRIGTSLVALGALSEGQLTATLAELQGVPAIDLGRVTPDRSAMGLLRTEFCERHLVLPLALTEERGRRVLRLAVADALDLPTFEAIEYQTNCRVQMVLAGATQVRAAIARWMRAAAPPVAGPVEFDRPAVLAAFGEDFEVEEAEVLPLVDELAPPRRGSLRDDYEFLFGRPEPTDPLQRLEYRIEGLARLLEAKGICGRHELERAMGVSLGRGNA